MVLVLGLFAFSCVMSQKTSTEYDDMYYIPSEKKAVQAADKQEPATGNTATEPDDYEKYIKSLEQKRAAKKASQVTYEDTLEYAEDQNYVDSEYYEEDGNTYVTNNYYGTVIIIMLHGSEDFMIRFIPSVFDSYYYDPFWYEPGWSFRMSFGYPYYGFGYSYGWPYSSWYWGSPYYYSYYGGYSPYWRNPYYGYGYNDYYGYNGYYGGWHNHGNNNHSPSYYGPRRTIENNRLANGSFL